MRRSVRLRRTRWCEAKLILCAELFSHHPFKVFSKNAHPEINLPCRQAGSG